MDHQETDSLLEMHLHGELPADLRKKAERILSTPEGRRRMEEIRASDERILRELPPARMAKAIERKMSASPVPRASAERDHARRWWLGATGGVLALGVLVLVVMMDRRSLPDPDTAKVAISGIDTGRVDTTAMKDDADRIVDDLLGARPSEHPPTEKLAVAMPPDDGIRMKGDIRRLRVHVVDATTGLASALNERDTTSPGSVLQISLLPGSGTWAAVVSVDGSGQATLHVPETGDSALWVKDAIQAPHSFQLDDAPGFERFFLVTSPIRFSLDEVLAVARRSGIRKPVRIGWTFQSIHVAKPEARP